MQSLEFKLGISSPGKKHYSYKRILRMVTYGVVIAGPIYHSW